jgi:hypothetical protein
VGDVLDGESGFMYLRARYFDLGRAVRPMVRRARRHTGSRVPAAADLREHDRR